MDPGAADVLRRAAAHQVVADVQTITLDDPARHHLFRVLRLRDGESVTVTDGAGRWRCGRVAGEALVPDGDVMVDDDRPTATIGVAIPKSDRPELIVQKLTELGVGRIVLLHCDRSVVRWDAERAPRHIAKLTKVAIEAVQQSRQVWLPELQGPRRADELLPVAVAAEPGGRALSERDRTIAIGPEGGWSDRELALASDRIGLGRSVLRVETAAIAAAAIVGHSRLGAPT